ncbi:hypothetical protein GCM10016455_22910 [Aliiroseovarius zhejiangensis]|uniref:Uncharacterized protein n=1 Tax=Aliiroseovarius zhejiangensis TaxID=1632025 RepID=A0ABQ3J1J8_9RHOB|nr:hypothetical protein [Aliiroseovarius zhejiangensis]GHF01186.1 hypothetical protein GCM10016455_22910 [Aliiroseovarius zhejiangensis]
MDAADYDALLTTPKMDPCHLFTADADTVVLYLDMGAEGEVQLALPRTYLEDRADQQSGLRHGSLLLRMMLESFLPVSRAQALRLSATRQDRTLQGAFVTMLISDLPNLEARMGELTRTPMDPAPNEVDLIPLSTTDPARRMAFAALRPDGTLRAVIECAASETAQRQACTHQLRSSGVDVVLDYKADLLPGWKDIQSRAERFLKCAADG